MVSALSLRSVWVLLTVIQVVPAKVELVQTPVIFKTPALATRSALRMVCVRRAASVRVMRTALKIVCVVLAPVSTVVRRMLTVPEVACVI